MKELLKRLNDIITFCEIKIKQSDELITQNNTLLSKLKGQQVSLDDREKVVTERESNAMKVDNIEMAHKEAHSKHVDADQRHLALNDRREALEKEYQQKNKKLDDELKNVEMIQEQLKQGQLTLERDRKDYRQRVIEAIHKDSEQGRVGTGVKKDITV